LYDLYNGMLIAYVWHNCLEEGAGREPVGGEKTAINASACFYINIRRKGPGGSR